MRRPNLFQYELLAALSAGPLTRCSRGWLSVDGHLFISGSVQAAARRGWVNVGDRRGGRARSVTITTIGRDALRYQAARVSSSTVSTGVPHAP